jgi:2-hydroxychromene-2-carboxylate isomerase
LSESGCPGFEDIQNNLLTIPDLKGAGIFGSVCYIVTAELFYGAMRTKFEVRGLGDVSLI